MTVHVPTKGWLFRSTRDVHARLYVEAQNPFTFTVVTYRQNPDLWATVPAPQDYTARADSGNTSVAKTLSAVDVYSVLIGDNQNYDMQTASFEAMNHSETNSGPPCHCGCDSPSSRLDHWDAGTVSFSLFAPTCGAHMCSLFDSCGGGGTHSEIYLRPTFRIKKRNVPETTSLTPHEWHLGRGAVTPDIQPTDPQWVNLQITGTFQDGDEKQQAVRLLSRDVHMASTDLWTATVDNDVLHISTH